MMYDELAKLLNGKVTARGSGAYANWALVKAKFQHYLFVSCHHAGTYYVTNPSKKVMRRVRADPYDLYYADDVEKIRLL